MIKDWEYRGLYHDDGSWTIRVEIQPDKLPKWAKDALLKYDLENGIIVNSIGCIRDLFMWNEYETWRKLEEVGLAREVGNAWNKQIRLAPGMREWIKKHQKKNKIKKSCGTKKGKMWALRKTRKNTRQS